MPGCGKSTVGRQLAKRLQVPFFDADAVIEARIGGTIRALFEAEGEAAFRDLEEQAIDELTRQAPSVIATGGGAVLRPANREHLKSRAMVIYLRTSPEQLVRRLRNDSKRPLLQVADPLKRLQTLYAERDPLYRETAHFVVEARGPSVAMLVNRIVMQIEMAGGVAPNP
ncbi:shikimate kinase [Ottowia thiooxydans]|uniref:shikimate kinase n=1 Tax=Ottowia thiooxydans TaxID=219182 RepID=UPI000568B233|nr:shikimate kinase [Ottowia thiooxydans]